MMGYLSSSELAEMVGCKPNSFACMRRWLTRNNWPFEVSINGFPIVSRAYHDARMSGETAAPKDLQPRIEPNFKALQ